MSDSPSEKVDFEAYYKRKLYELKNEFYWLREVQATKFGKIDERFALLIQRIIDSFQDLEADAMQKCEGYIEEVRHEITDAYRYYDEIIKQLRGELKIYTVDIIVSSEFALRYENHKMINELEEKLKKLKKLIKSFQKQQRRFGRRFAELESQTEERFHVVGAEVAQVADLQSRTEERLQVIGAEVADLQSRTEERLQVIGAQVADLQSRTEERLQVFGAQVADLESQTEARSHVLGAQVAVLMARIESLENSHQMSNIIAYFFALALTFALMFLSK